MAKHKRETFAKHKDQESDMLRRGRENGTEEPESFDKDDEESIKLDAGLPKDTALHLRVMPMGRKVHWKPFLVHQHHVMD